MKKLKCDLCNHEEQGETFEQWMQALQSHYMQAHADFMQAKSGLSEAEQKAEMKTWMDENRARFDAA